MSGALILVVEDNDRNAKLLRDVLEHRGYRVLVAVTGEEGVSLAEHDFTTNSRKALLLAEAAKEAGSEVFYRLHRRLFEAFFVDGLNIGDETVLTGLASECGVPRDIVQRAWTDERYAAKLQQYLAAAAQYRVRATPTVFFDEQHRLDGALPFEAFLAAAKAGYESQQASVPL